MTKPKIVTRYIDKMKNCDLKVMRGRMKAFYTGGDLVNENFSVYDIDAELANNDNDAIYRLSDKYVFSRPPAVARADLDVADIEKIEYRNNPLNLVYSKNPSKKHYIVVNFPNNEDDAQLIATQLAFKSRLHIRNS